MRLNVPVAAVAAALAGCVATPYEVPTATAVLVPLDAKAQAVRGVVQFTPGGGSGLRVVADVEGLAAGAKGIHVHENGDCRSAQAPGGHFDPAKSRHGGADGPVRHAGDIGNLVPDPQGRATMAVPVTGLTIESGPRSVVGRSVVVHASPDDLRTDPAGGSGERIACGIIVRTQPWPDRVRAFVRDLDLPR